MSDKVLIDREALECVLNGWDNGNDVALLLGTDAIRDALAQEAEPVAWRDHVEQRIRTWKQRTMNRSGDHLAIDDFMGESDIDDLVDFVCDEWADPPAAVPDLRDAKWLDPECADRGACQSLRFKAPVVTNAMVDAACKAFNLYPQQRHVAMRAAIEAAIAAKEK